MSDDNFLFHKTANELRAHPETLAVRVSREHYLYLAEQIEQFHHQIDRLEGALNLIASFGGKTLIAPSLDELNGDRGHQIGAAKAFEQTADIARDVLKIVMPQGPAGDAGQVGWMGGE